MNTRLLLGALAVGVLVPGAGRIAAARRAYPSSVVKHGEYLVNALAGCSRCHTPRKGGEFDNSRFMAGGTEFKSEAGVVSAFNLTPDSDTGLGKWTDKQIIDAMAKGVDKDGNNLMPPMPRYDRVTPADMRAIVAYLRSLKPIHNPIPKRQRATAPAATAPGK